VPLNIVKYKKMQEDIRTASKKLEEYSKTGGNLSVESLAVDAAEIASDTTKVSKQNQFVKSISGDLYVNETVKALNQIIGEAILVQRSELVQ
jgi:hypothetical protein